MRKVAFIGIEDESRKVMIYQSNEGVFLFGYDCLQDTCSKWDNWFLTVQDAEEYCKDVYKLTQSDWIAIADPLEYCQDDFIMPTRLEGRDIGQPQYGQFETLENGKWVNRQTDTKYTSLNGLTGDERLFISGLIHEFDQAKEIDKAKARQILMALKFDTKSIEQII